MPSFGGAVVSLGTFESPVDWPQSRRPAIGCHAASAARLAVIRRGCEINGSLDDCIADETAVPYARSNGCFA